MDVNRWQLRLITTTIYLNAVGEEERDIAARLWTNHPRPVGGSYG